MAAVNVIIAWPFARCPLTANRIYCFKTPLRFALPDVIPSESPGRAIDSPYDGKILSTLKL
jgi:hypothetical protein